jgi:hypothetical protein
MKTKYTLLRSDGPHNPPDDAMRQFVSRVIVPALLARLHRERDAPDTLRLSGSVEWQPAWKGMAA